MQTKQKMDALCANDFAEWVAQSLVKIERALERFIDSDSPAALGEIMRYAVLDGGKRLRPLLLLCIAETFQEDSDGGVTSAPMQFALQDLGLRAACAVELIHAYSLVHDDLPCMDDDVLRRGKPTAHVRYGEAQALLAGDALQALAFEIMVADFGQGLDAAQAKELEARIAPIQVRLCRLLGAAAGAFGMAGGQAIDLQHVGKTLAADDLRTMHQLKTGALLHASIMMGAAFTSLEEDALAELSKFGHATGLLFQVVDDILDVIADSATLGKTAGKDALAGKPTYVSVMGLEPARAYAPQIEAEALSALQGLQTLLPQADTTYLQSLLAWVAGRTH